jgi:ditrans,polycis-polyprenyl diphosphate synthase
MKNGLKKKTSGHVWGFEKLHEALEWCFDAGVKAVTVYAFSIENFKRPKEEVDTLMGLAKEKFGYMLKESDLMRRNKAVIRVWGDLSLLSKDLREMVDSVMRQTAGNSGPQLNVCFPYTSSYEMVATTKKLAAECREGQLALDDITISQFEKRMFSQGDHPEILVRTSGETRLSDFFCWQTGQAQFLVYKCLWPEFSLWHFVMAVLTYRFNKGVYNK